MRKVVTSTLTPHLKTMLLTPILANPRQSISYPNRVYASEFLEAMLPWTSMLGTHFASLTGNLGEVTTNKQPLVMRMIFHDLVWLMSLSREWHFRSQSWHMFFYRELCSDSQLPVSVIPFFVMEIYTDGVPRALMGFISMGLVVEEVKFRLHWGSSETYEKSLTGSLETQVSGLSPTTLYQLVWGGLSNLHF